MEGPFLAKATGTRKATTGSSVTAIVQSAPQHLFLAWTNVRSDRRFPVSPASCGCSARRSYLLRRGEGSC